MWRVILEEAREVAWLALLVTGLSVLSVGFAIALVASA